MARHHLEMVRKILARYDIDDVDPRHVLAFMYQERTTLDGIDCKRFRRIALDCVPDVRANRGAAEALATFEGI